MRTHQSIPGSRGGKITINGGGGSKKGSRNKLGDSTIETNLPQRASITEGGLREGKWNPQRNSAGKYDPRMYLIQRASKKEGLSIAKKTKFMSLERGSGLREKREMGIKRDFLVGGTKTPVWNDPPRGGKEP